MQTSVFLSLSQREKEVVGISSKQRSLSPQPPTEAFQPGWFIESLSRAILCFPGPNSHTASGCQTSFHILGVSTGYVYASWRKGLINPPGDLQPRTAPSHFILLPFNPYWLLHRHLLYGGDLNASYLQLR